MRPSHRRRLAAAPTLALAAWTTACYTTAPYRPAPAGATSPARHVSVEIPPSARVHLRSASGDTVSTTGIAHLTGRAAELRGDTIVVREPTIDGMLVRFTPPGRETTVAAAVLLPPEAHARLGVRQFSGQRTTLLAVGVAAVLAVVAAASLSAAIDKGVGQIPISGRRR